MACLAQPPVDRERRVDDARLLHVDADERAERLGDLHDALDVGVRQLLVELEAEVRELERDVAGKLLGVEALENASVLVRHGLRVGAVTDALAEERGVRMEPLAGEAAQHDHALVERLAGHEPARPEAHAVPVHEAPDVPIVGGVEDPCAEHRVRAAGRAHRVATPTFCASHASSSAASPPSRSRSGCRTSDRRALPAGRRCA